MGVHSFRVFFGKHVSLKKTRHGFSAEKAGKAESAQNRLGISINSQLHSSPHLCTSSFGHRQRKQTLPPLSVFPAPRFSQRVCPKLVIQEQINCTSRGRNEKYQNPREFIGTFGVPIYLDKSIWPPKSTDQS